MKTERILEMLSSGEKEMIRLGMVLAIGKGYSWCKEHIPRFGYPPVNIQREMMYSGNKEVFAIANDEIIVINNYYGRIDARPVKELRTSVGDWTHELKDEDITKI